MLLIGDLSKFAAGTKQVGWHCWRVGFQAGSKSSRPSSALSGWIGAPQKLVLWIECSVPSRFSFPSVYPCGKQKRDRDYTTLEIMKGKRSGPHPSSDLKPRPVTTVLAKVLQKCKDCRFDRPFLFLRGHFSFERAHGRPSTLGRDVQWSKGGVEGLRTFPVLPFRVSSWRFAPLYYLIVMVTEWLTERLNMNGDSKALLAPNPGRSKGLYY